MSSPQCHLVLLALLLVINTATTSGYTCRASFNVRGPGKPLLFGGLGEQGRCRSGCQPRTGEWSKRCGWSGPSWGVCTQHQAQRSFGAAKTLGGGAILNLSPCDVMKYLQGRTLWIIGDSHSKSLYRALACFLFDFWNQKECEASTNAAAVQQLYKLPMQPGQSKCFHLLGGGRVCVVYAVIGTSLTNNKQVAYGGVMPLLRARFAKPQDIFYVSFGSWHSKTTQLWNALRPSLEALGADYKARRSQFPHLLFREQPAYHKATGLGHTCQAAKGFVYQASNGRLEYAPAAKVAPMMMWQLGGTTTQITRQVLPKYGIPIVSGFNITVPLDDVHVTQYGSLPGDCTHYCHPGMPESWIWQLYTAMRAGKAGIKPLSGGSAAYKCVASYTAGFTV